MANLHSSLYGAVSKAVTSSGAITASTDRIYYGPSAQQQGNPVTRIATYTGTIANADVLKIAGGFVDGERLVSLDISTSTDPDTDNDGQVDIGTTTDPNGILAASTGFQAGADVNVETSGQAVATLTFVQGDELILTMTTGEHEVSATYTFTIVTTV